MLLLITLCLAIYTSVHAVEKCHKSSTCSCEDDFIEVCQVTIEQKWIQRLDLKSIAHTKFSDNFNISNLATIKTTDDEKLGILFFNWHSPIKNYSQFIHFMDKRNATLKAAYFMGTGIGQVELFNAFLSEFFRILKKKMIECEIETIRINFYLKLGKTVFLQAKN